jgi:hypothetical protein
MNPRSHVDEQPGQVRPRDCLPSCEVPGSPPAPVRCTGQLPAPSRCCPSGPLCPQLGPFPVLDNLRSTAYRERVKAVARFQAPKGCYHVRSTLEPAEFVETAQHAVRRFSAVAANSHLFPPRLPAWAKVSGQRTRGRDRNQLATFQLPFATKDDLGRRCVIAHIYVCQPDEVSVRVRSYAANRANACSGDANDHLREHKSQVDMTTNVAACNGRSVS